MAAGRHIGFTVITITPTLFNIETSNQRQSVYIDYNNYKNPRWPPAAILDLLLLL
jgi:hypothetical protein